MNSKELYDRFTALFPSGETLGLIQGDKHFTYYCTPVNAEIIGWAGVDGIHACFIPSISDDMIFVVSPCNYNDDKKVYPVAKNFYDFLSLILSCGDFAPLEQISWMSIAQYQDLIKEIKSEDWPERDTALLKLRTVLKINPYPQPYEYVKNLQASFDYSAIPFSNEYYDTI